MDAMHQMLLLVHWHMNYTYCGIMWIVDFMRKNICQLSGLLIFYCFDFHLLTSCLVCVFFLQLGHVRDHQEILLSSSQYYKA